MNVTHLKPKYYDCLIKILKVLKKKKLPNLITHLACIFLTITYLNAYTYIG